MLRISFLATALLLGAGRILALPSPAQKIHVFTGNISDSACGLQHMMASDSPLKCTLECINMGAKFVLADETHHRVYALSDQAKAKPFAGEKVVVKGTLKGAMIEVRSIAAAK